MSSRFRLGFDIGGTFTDFVMIDAVSGQAHLNKRLTTPDDPSRAVIEGLGELLGRIGASGADIEIPVHATTLITNALIERRGAKTALLTTQGFRDILELGHEARYDVFDLHLPRSQPLVPRQLRFEVTERLDKNGDVLISLDEEAVRRIGWEMRQAGIEAVGVAFLHAYRNGAHEERAAAILREMLPDATVCISSAVAPEIREYERTSTTVANAYVQPITKTYLNQISGRLAAIACARQLFLMLSSGGLASVHTAIDYPIRLLESGPSAGMLAALHYSRLIGIESMVTFDMGGTTAKVGLIKDRQPEKSNTFEFGRVARFRKGSGLPVKVPMIELIEIGAGGGSIARVDDLGLLKVGPHSASSIPGPACYGRGGEQPTVTDANLVLGYLSPDYFLGGAMRLDPEASRRALQEKLGRALGLSAEDCARGIFQVVNESMLSAMKVHIAERGEDPRKFYLFAFGGAGPAHAYELARALHMKGVIVPPGAGTSSAMGLVTAPVSCDLAKSFVTRLNAVELDDIRSVFDGMAKEGLAMLVSAGVARDDPQVATIHSMDLRYKGQGHEVTVKVPGGAMSRASLDAIAEEFHGVHQQKYSHAHRHLPIELVTCRTSVAAPAPDLPASREAAHCGPVGQAIKQHREVFFGEAGGYLSTPVYDRYRLGAGASFAGPAIVEERECTLVIGPSGHVRIDATGTIFIDLAVAETERRSVGAAEAIAS
ncbi:MAG: hydantoinase/oxoprolinase family protein [Rhizobiaceae bacterium]